MGKGQSVYFKSVTPGKYVSCAPVQVNTFKIIHKVQVRRQGLKEREREEKSAQNWLCKDERVDLGKVGWEV